MLLIYRPWKTADKVSLTSQVVLKGPTMTLLELPTPLRTVAPPDADLRLPHSAARAACAAGEFRYARLQLSEGASAGVELILVDAGQVRAAICPTRGMSLWKAHMADIPCGWKSPVQGPVHPSFVPLDEPSGLGWLDGFDELLVRCGLRNFGAPDFAANGQLRYPLHGRIGNLPGRNVALELDESHSLLHITGEVHETRFLQHNLRLQVKYTFALGENQIAIHDVVTNAGATPTTMQLLYHINLGAPLLETGAKLHVNARRAVARNRHAADGLAEWQTYLPPTAGYQEQVYFFESHAGGGGWSTALLTSAQADRGFAVHYRPDCLPYFSQWKNTVADSDGYVTGLEPGTGFPNPRSFEEEKGRVVALAAGESREFQLTLEGINSADRLTKLTSEIEADRGGPMATTPFDANWCVAES